MPYDTSDFDNYLLIPGFLLFELHVDHDEDTESRIESAVLGLNHKRRDAYLDGQCPCIVRSNCFVTGSPPNPKAAIAAPISSAMAASRPG